MEKCIIPSNVGNMTLYTHALDHLTVLMLNSYTRQALAHIFISSKLLTLKYKRLEMNNDVLFQNICQIFFNFFFLCEYFVIF